MHVLSRFECLISITLLRECWHVISLWGVEVVLELTDPNCSQRPSCEAIYSDATAEIADIDSRWGGAG